LESSELSQLCAQSLFARSKPLPSRTWSAKWKRDSWMQHLSGRILRPSLGNRFATAWTSSLEAIHASHSVQPASDLEGKTPGISGRTSQEAFQFFNQESASLKTSRATLPAGCITFCATWEDWVTERRGAYSARLNAVRHTNASECLSWPTAATRDWKGVPSTETGWHRPDNGKLRNDTLDKAVAIYGPAVPASSSTDGSRPGWLTPQAQDSKHSGTNPTENGERDLLVNQVNWATPIAGDWKGQVAARPNAGKLNSRWVETLMGLPVGWTMPSCQSPVTIALTNSDSSVTELSQQPPL
jgi:hypothetical protein